MRNCTCEREIEEKGRGSKNGIVSHRTAPALEFIFGPLLKLFLSTVREPFFCKFPLIKLSVAFIVAHQIPPTRKQFVPTVVDEITAERSRRWLTESIEVAG